MDKWVGSVSILSASLDTPKWDFHVFEDSLRTNDLSNEDQVIARELVTSLKKFGHLPFELGPQENYKLSVLSKKDWLGYLIYRYKFKIFPNKQIVSDFPNYLLIEIMSVCNLRCTMCFQSDKSFTKKPYMGMMDMGLYRSVVNQAAEGGTQAITFASRGEPTLHPDLPDMLRYLEGKFQEVKINTNATRLTEQLCHDILSSDLDILVFSVDAHTKDLYEQIRLRGQFDVVLENIKRFHRIRDRHYPASTLRTRIAAVKFRDDQDPEAFCGFWSDIVDEVGMKSARLFWDTYGNEPHPENLTPCSYLWEHMYVWFDGLVNPCDSDYKSYLCLGDAKTTSIRDIWHGQAFSRLRSLHHDKQRNTIIPCDRCGQGC